MLLLLVECAVRKINLAVHIDGCGAGLTGRVARIIAVLFACLKLYFK